MKRSHLQLPLRRWLLGVTVMALGCPPVAFAAQPADAPPAAATESVVHGAQEKAAFLSLDRRIARFAGMAEKDPDATHKAAEWVIVETFQKRSEAMQKLAFDQTKFDEFVFEITVEEQRQALWLRELTTPPQKRK